MSLFEDRANVEFALPAGQLATIKNKWSVS